MKGVFIELWADKREVVNDKLVKEWVVEGRERKIVCASWRWKMNLVGLNDEFDRAVSLKEMNLEVWRGVVWICRTINRERRSGSSRRRLGCIGRLRDLGGVVKLGFDRISQDFNRL
ncbi:hypothetical protein ACFXTO_027615 [Malus domestica]